MPKSKNNFIHNSKREMFLFGIGLLVSMSQICQAQWKLIHSFGNHAYISSMCFINNKDTDNYTCFMGFYPFAPQTYAEIWRTTNGGVDWQRVFKAQSRDEDFVSAIVFKDSNTGWFSLRDFGHTPGLGGCYKTEDGGNTWTKLSLDSFGVTYGDDCTAVYYHRESGMLFLSRWAGDAQGPPLISADEGNSWMAIDPTDAAVFDGYAFINFVGIASTASGVGNYYRTTDGGRNWSRILMDTEAWQPTGFGNNFYLLSEISAPFERDRGLLCRSSDFGITWKPIYHFPFGVSGCILTDSNRLYVQGVDSLEEWVNRLEASGVYFSEDSGFTWTEICGGNSVLDTRFYVNHGRVWVGDKLNNLWLNSTGIGSNSILQLSSTSNFFNGLGCISIFDSIITFTFFDSCNNIQAKLVSAQMKGSQNFSFTSPSAIPRSIHPNDSLLISYNPTSAIPDTADLHLKFHLGWKDFDTTIHLTGAGRIPKESIKFIPSQKNYSAIAGGGVSISYFPDKNISGRNLDSISFDLGYDTDLLDYRSISTSIPGATITFTSPPSPLPLSQMARVSIRKANMTLDSLQPIATIIFKAMVAKATTTPIIMSNLQLNGGDQNYADCILSADSSNSEFTIIPSCGDTTLRNFLSGIFPTKIISLRPNPAQDEIEIDLNSAAKQEVSVEIRNALGAKLVSQNASMTSGLNSIRLDTKNLSGGVYVVRIGNASETFVKVR